MSTELQRQLSAHRSKYVQPKSIEQGKASLFLTLKEAAGLDIESVHDAAVKHANILMQYDSRFAPFFENVLHVSSITFQRELKTEEVCT